MNIRPWRCGLCIALSLALCVVLPTAVFAQSEVDAAPDDDYPPHGSTPIDTSPHPPQGEVGGGGESGKNWLIPAVIVGAAALFSINRHLKAEQEEVREGNEGVKQLLRDGPQLPTQFNASAFGIRALVRGGWPIVVDYALHRSGRVQLRISIPGADIVTYRLDQFGLGRHLLRFDLPSFLGDNLKPAVVALTAADPQTGTETIGDFTVHGIGIGPRAVGSIAVDQLEFNPGEVRVRNGDTASFAFRSRSDFDNSAVEYMHITQSPDGARKRYVNGQHIGNVRRGSRVESTPSQRWNGQNEQAHVSTGRHQLQVRVWDDGGDWIGAWSEALVRVQ